MTQKKLPHGFVPPSRLADLPNDTPMLVAFSGGADSSALLSMCVGHSKKTGAKIYAAHVDHLIRPDEHERDRRFCERIAAEYGIELFVLEADIPSIAAQTGESLELAARRVRYEFFEKLMKEHNIGLLVTAHNADDNLETLIMNLIRGSGLNGMCGIPQVRLCHGGIIARPLLSMSKSEILSYCAENGIEYVTDSTNAVVDCSRNRIRLNVIPELTKINSAAVKNAARFSEIMNEAEAYLDEAAEKFILAHKSEKGVPTNEISRLPSPIRAKVFAKLCHGRLETVHVDALTELCQKSTPHSSVSLPERISAVIENGYLCFVSAADGEQLPAPPFDVMLSNGKNELGNGLSVIVSDSTVGNRTTACIALNQIRGNLSARQRKSGDRITINGVNRSVKKLMCDKKIPLELRDRLPIIYDEKGIAYIPYLGVRDGMSAKNDDKVTYITLTDGKIKEGTI